MSEHEFQWRRGMRELGGPVQPGRDLWLDIAARIEAEASAAQPAPVRRRWALPLAAAASIAAGVLIASHWLAGVPSTTTIAHEATDPRPALDRATHELKQVRPQDPRLAGAVAELDSAAAELQQMLQQQPDAVFLVGLLNRTNERRMKLARMGLASS
ncbi:MAG TPA: hypothetical protein VM555_09170 [Tahibacter sp.]|nr:hypothetical protein [Tahibacter sp.]